MPQETMIVALSAIGPVIGSGIGVFKRPTTAYIHNMLYFAAGIMLAISFLDLIPESIHLGGTFACVAGISLGATAMAGLDRLFPHVHDCAACGKEECQLGHTANFLILAIFLHNFPEGMAIAIGAATDVGDSLVIALAIAIHNIPEGICTSAPHYFTYGNRLKSFLMSSLSALPIVVGYMAARYLFVQISPQLMSVLVGATAGLMIYIAADELMPAARNGNGGQTIFFFIFGIIAVMLIELLA
ncbi:ZIP family metal transporter [Desulfosarcina sp.]|uniref:ZIP family metal transporter n=1 Tax=Desulfosarcina sp. TaxID=2027861 RepID=UPI003562866E